MVAHASPATVAEGHAYTGEVLVQMYWTFAFRALGKIAEFHGIDLDETERGVLDLANASVLDKGSRRGKAS
jgi:hypothetical protein